MRRRLLLHACCAPCTTVTAPHFREQGAEPTLFFYNPNIHPWREWKHRLDTLEGWAPGEGLPLIVDESYPIEENLRMLLGSQPRCTACLSDRLMVTAMRAAKDGFESFSTTLMLSPYTDHDLLREAGRRASEFTGIPFEYSDLRPFYHISVQLSRQAGLYRQPYCGCVFSESERFNRRAALRRNQEGRSAGVAGATGSMNS